MSNEDRAADDFDMIRARLREIRREPPGTAAGTCPFHGLPSPCQTCVDRYYRNHERK